MSFTSAVVADSHYQGKIHAKRLKLLLGEKTPLKATGMCVKRNRGEMPEFKQRACLLNSAPSSLVAAGIRDSWQMSFHTEREGAGSPGKPYCHGPLSPIAGAHSEPGSFRSVSRQLATSEKLFTSCKMLSVILIVCYVRYYIYHAKNSVFP